MGTLDHGVTRLILDLCTHQLAIGLQHLGDHNPLAENRITIHHAVEVENLIRIGVRHRADILGLPLHGRFVGLDLRLIQHIFLEHPAMCGKMA
jgi:hypothetical protein